MKHGGPLGLSGQSKSLTPPGHFGLHVKSTGGGLIFHAEQV